VVERQRRQDDFLSVLDLATGADLNLGHVGQDISLEQHRALRHAGRATGVLQECQVVGLECRLLQPQGSPAGERGLNSSVDLVSVL
jgi:hypothetical protein